MNLQKQELLISYLASDPDLFTRCNGILDQNYFDPECRHSVHFIKTFYDEFRALPSADQIKAETGNSVNIKPLAKSEIEYALKEVEVYCRNKAIEKAILSSPALLDKEDFDKILVNMREAISVSINRDIGIDYFANPEERLRQMLLYNPLIPTGYMELDLLLNGGVGRKELLLLMAGSGVGKSIMMSNLARNFMQQKLNVVYITLELSENTVSKRFDTILTGIPQNEIFEKISKVVSDLEELAKVNGHLRVKRMPESTTNANHVRAFLKEYEMERGHVPDVIIVDYMDLMTTNTKISAENLFVKDKYIAEELRSIGNDFNALVVSASQMNRSAVRDTDIDQSNIAGGISKINTCDNLFALIQTEAMKAAGEYMLKLVKTRNSGGVGKIIMLRWDARTLRVLNANDPGKRDNLEFVSASEMKKDKKKDLLDLMSI